MHNMLKLRIIELKINFHNEASGMWYLEERGQNYSEFRDFYDREISTQASKFVHYKGWCVQTRNTHSLWQNLMGDLYQNQYLQWVRQTKGNTIGQKSNLYIQQNRELVD